MKLGLGLGFGRNGGSGFWILLGGAYGGSFNETVGTTGVIGTATSNMTGTLTWSIVAGGDARISINSSTGAVSTSTTIYSGSDAAFTVQVTNGTLTIGFPFTAVGIYQQESTTLFTAMSGSPNSTYKTAINTAIASLKTAGVFAKLDALQVYRGSHDSSHDALVDWKLPSRVATNSGGTFALATGFTTSGSPNYIDTGYNPGTSATNFTQNSCSFGIWSMDGASKAGSAAGYYDTGTTAGITINPREGANFVAGRINTVTAVTSTPTTTNGLGLTSVVRASSTIQKFNKSGTTIASPASTSTTIKNGNITLGRINASSYSGHAFAAVFAGGALDDTEMTALNNALSTYFTAVGA